ncbi:MAG: hypothetical protein L3J04_08825 [Robiginitomaculum sp.]|nr:hypothetical protein [Robiginitomaculum sp.]
MKFSRRNFIRILGGSAIIMAPIACSSVSNTPDPTAPWADANTANNPIKFVLSHALLAPNPHNRQPWMIQLHDETAATLFVDPSQDLPETDPFDRQITIGLGCFLEVLTIAANNQGFQAKIDYFPEGFNQQTLDKRPIAKIELLRASSLLPDPLFGQILHRRTNRKPFNEQQVPTINLIEITKETFGTNNGFASSTTQIEQLRQLTIAAAEMEFETPHTYMESVNLMRIGSAEIAKNPDGISIDIPMIGLLKAFGIVSKKTLSDQTSSAFKQGLKQYSDAAASSANFIWISTNTNTRIDQINTGRTYVRQNLLATKLGISMQPLSQALQEYPEMQQLLEEAHKVTQINGQRLQMLARIGYAATGNASPRFPLSAKLIEHENNQH